MSFLNSLASLALSRRRTDLEFFVSNPLLAQEKVFKNLISRAADTEWGKTFAYQNIKTVGDFRAQVPLQSYNDLQPFVERAQKGEKNILWPGEIKWFARSSGTTGAKSKFIPVTAESLEDGHYRGGRDMLYLYNEARPDNNLFSGKTLTLGGTREKDANNIYCGDLSAILMSNLPLWVQFVRTPDLDIALLGEWEEKIKKIAAASIKENITCLVGTPSWMLVLLYYILDYTKKNNISEVWPNLEVFFHGGISFDPYREQFKKIIPSPKMNYFETYNASEGFFAMNEKPGDTDMLLMLDYGIFYEFIPLEEIDSPRPRPLGLSEVELGKNYAVVISTNGGLWRYIIGDTVSFTSLKPFKIKITGRTKHFINAFGEELMVGNADQGLAAACRKTGADIKDYTAAPQFMSATSRGRHQWIIEFNRAPADLKAFGSSLDEALKSLNSDYEAKRYKDITLGSPEIILARENLFYDWLKQKNKLGGQNKIPRLANNRDYLEELLAMN